MALRALYAKLHTLDARPSFGDMVVRGRPTESR
jgi:hypothetical protein